MIEWINWITQARIEGFLTATAIIEAIVFIAIAIVYWIDNDY